MKRNANAILLIVALFLVVIALNFVFFVDSRGTDEDELTGAQIKTLAGVPADYELFQVKGEQTVPVGNEQRIHLHNNEHFRAIPAGTFGSE